MLSHLTRTRLRAGLRVSHGWGECAARLCLAAIYPREEPDALRSARPGPCGGHQATGVPTAIAKHELPPTSTRLCMMAACRRNLGTPTFSSQETSEMLGLPVSA